MGWAKNLKRLVQDYLAEGKKIRGQKEAAYYIAKADAKRAGTGRTANVSKSLEDAGLSAEDVKKLRGANATK